LAKLGPSTLKATLATKAFISELLHGVNYGTYDKSNELVELSFIVTKD